jgi:hypothetical protein
MEIACFILEDDEDPMAFGSNASNWEAWVAWRGGSCWAVEAAWLPMEVDVDERWLLSHYQVIIGSPFSSSTCSSVSLVSQKQSIVIFSSIPSPCLFPGLSCPSWPAWHSISILYMC